MVTDGMGDGLIHDGMAFHGILDHDHHDHHDPCG